MSAILIGILEDDLDQSALLQVWLEDAGFETRVYASGPEFIRAGLAEPERDSIETGAYCLDRKAISITMDGVDVPLTRREFELT